MKLIIWRRTTRPFRGAVVCTLMLMAGCTSSRELFIEDIAPTDSATKFVGKSDVVVKDQDYLLSNNMTSKDVYKLYGVTSVSDHERRLEVHLMPCTLEKPFWSNPYSLLSVLTFTLVPIYNTFKCKAELTEVDFKKNQIKTFKFEQKYVLSFGIITSIFMGLGTSTVMFGYKEDLVSNLINEAGK